MPNVADISAFLEEKVPSSLMESYDNVGLLCGFPEQEVTRILVVLDVTLEAIQEANALGAELIVAHHPVIFTPMRQILSTSPEGRRVILLLKSGLSAICLHTNLDRLEGGVNTALARAVVGEEGEMLPEIGCICRLPEKMRMPLFLEQTREALGALDMRYHDAGRDVESVAVCGGAGGDIIYTAAKLGCDTVLTGEIKHHQWIDGAELGLNLIEGGHFATENVVTGVLAELLRREYPEVDVCLSRLQGSVSQGYGF
ncbi:MAG: Nif3-like dinuclear metal center hexameric protein [Oscillospiraceae bacterium]|nr:Nif3-like dinuclear metal center hexameric protein [Oscillospiraceae bacterium]